MCVCVCIRDIDMVCVNVSEHVCLGERLPLGVPTGETGTP